jgi:hypothetical protein
VDEKEQHGFEELDKAFESVVQECRDRGFEFPLMIATICANGTTSVIRVDGVNDPEIIVEHNVDRVGEPPANIMIVDAAGRAIRVRIERNGSRSSH